jgi:membrane protein implicated in regulation of membrane protease activity
MLSRRPADKTHGQLGFGELELVELRRRGVMVGKRGRVIGRIAPGIVGEVMLPVRGATEAFYAYPATDEAIEVGTQVVVVDFDPPRTVYVARAI